MKPPHLIKLLILITTLAVAIAAIAAVPQTINYQGYLKNTDGTPVSVATNMTFRLYSSAGSPTSSALWTEADRITPVNGVYSLELGSLTPFGAPAFDRPYFLGITVGRDLTEIAPRQPLTSVPYAFRTATSDSVVNGLYSTGAYSDPAWLTSLAGSKITGSVASATTALNAATAINAATVTNGIYTTGNYANPPWITSLAGSKIVGGISVAGQVESSSGGFKFPDATVQMTAANPPWSQILPSIERFVIVMGSEAVLDKETGLVWERSTDSFPRIWIAALGYCYNLERGGRKGWRLPSVDELSSLVDRSQYGPALPTGHPFTSAYSSFYWSSTSDADQIDNMMYVHFSDGEVGSIDKIGNAYVRCVRGSK